MLRPDPIHICTHISNRISPVSININCKRPVRPTAAPFARNLLFLNEVFGILRLQRHLHLVFRNCVPSVAIPHPPSSRLAPTKSGTYYVPEDNDVFSASP